MLLERSVFVCCETLRYGIGLCQESVSEHALTFNSVAFWKSFPQCFLSVYLFFRRRGPMNITDTVAGNPRFHDIKTALCYTALTHPFR